MYDYILTITTINGRSSHYKKATSSIIAIKEILKEFSKNNRVCELKDISCEMLDMNFMTHYYNDYHEEA